MSWWQVATGTLAGSRFATSPLAEALAGLKTLHGGSLPTQLRRDDLAQQASVRRVSRADGGR